VHADEKLTAFVELESAICACGELSRQAGEISPKLPGMKTSIPPVLITFLARRFGSSKTRKQLFQRPMEVIPEATPQKGKTPFSASPLTVWRPRQYRHR